MEVFTVAEHIKGELSPISIELLHLANSIKGPDKSNAIVLSSDARAFSEHLAKYADKVWAIESEILACYDPEVYADIICQVVRSVQSALVLVGDTPVGKEFAPTLAVKLKAPIQTDVMEVDLSDKVSISKYILQGNIMIDVELQQSDFYVLTIRQKIVKEGPQVTGSIEVVHLEPSMSPRRQFSKYIELEIGDVDITKKDILITVGRGLGNVSNMDFAEDLAKLLGGVTAGSRPVIDSGWLPKDRQIGSSGRKVNPKLYLGLGVSGASQHVMGMKDSELIIAINKDPDAPIFTVAEYGIIGDLKEIVPELVNQIREVKKYHDG